MLDRNLILSGLPIGLTLGVALWAVAGRDGSQSEALDAVGKALQAPRASARANAGQVAPPAFLAPLFVQPEASATAVEVSVVLQGLTRTPRRQAALVAIGGRPADWLALGETRDDVTLDGIRANSITITTPTGSREVAFGAVAPGASSPTQPPELGPMAGQRSPPPPASAPSVP